MVYKYIYICGIDIIIYKYATYMIHNVTYIYIPYKYIIIYTIYVCDISCITCYASYIMYKYTVHIYSKSNLSECTMRPGNKLE